MNEKMIMISEARYYKMIETYDKTIEELEAVKKALQEARQELEATRATDPEALMLEDLENARKYSLEHGTVWAASNGKEIIWSDSRSQVNRPGFWVCAIFEDGHRVEA